MVRGATVPNSGDPLSGFNSPSIRTSANVPVPSELKALDSVQNVLRSAQKLINKAKKIVDVGRTSILAASESWKKHRKSPVGIDSVLKILSRERLSEQEPGADPINHVSSPTPPRSPLESISLLKKRILQMDPFSPLNIVLFSRPNASPSPSEQKDKIIGEVDAHNDAHESNPHVFEDGVKVDTSSRRQMDTEQPLEVSTAKPHGRKTVEGKKCIRNPPVFKEEARVDTSGRQQMDIEQPLEVLTAKPQRKKTVAGEKQNAHPMRTSLAEAGTTFENGLRRSKRIRSSPLEFWKGDNSLELIGVKSYAKSTCVNYKGTQVLTAKPQRKKTVAGEKRIRNAHPMRKSLAEADTTFENGLRRSKRIRSRPLEFWKGERFVFGRVDNSVELIGVKKNSLGEGTEKLKVTPYISLETSANKEIFELAVLH